jgi:hypothetical protein
MDACRPFKYLFHTFFNFNANYWNKAWDTFWSKGNQPIPLRWDPHIAHRLLYVVIIHLLSGSEIGHNNHAIAVIGDNGVAAA